jgi:hypothetical protein
MQPSQLAAAKAAEHGRNIFIYNNIRTNQVIYSLTRTIYVRPPVLTLPHAFPY